MMEEATYRVLDFCAMISVDIQRHAISIMLNERIRTDIYFELVFRIGSERLERTNIGLFIMANQECFTFNWMFCVRKRRRGSHYSWLTTFCGWPTINALMFSMVISINRCLEALVAHATCGVIIQLGNPTKG